MNRNLRAALWIVAAVSIAIALYYPVTQYLEGKALDDEMLMLRRMKAEAVSGAPDEPLAVQTGQSAVPGGTPDANADPGRETSGAGSSETANGLSDRMAEPYENTTDRKADTHEADANTSGGTAVADENTGNAAGRKAEADESTGGSTGRAAVTEDAADSDTDRSTNMLDGLTNSMPDHSGAAGTEREEAGTNGFVNGDFDDNAGGDTADSAQDAGGTAEKQTGVGEVVSLEPGSTDKAAMSDKSAFGGTPSPAEKSVLAPTLVPEPEPTPFVFDESKILPEYKALYEENRDLVGWLKIDGTMVDYPVLQRADEEYYLTRDFYGNSNANGQLILDAQCDPFAPDVNLVISGHDMKSGKMFGTLQRYGSERFGKQHPIIEFDTLFWRGRYRLIAAFQTWDSLKREDGFRYNVDIRYRLELKKFLEELDQIKMYDTGVPVEFGDQLITLSTCSTQTDDGRFVVVARRLREGEQP